MNVNCPECRSVFRVDPAKVPATGVRARCSVCGGVIAISGGTLPVSITPANAAAAVPAFGGGTSRATPARGVSSSPTPAAASQATAGQGTPARSTPVYAPPLRSATPSSSPAFAPAPDQTAGPRRFGTPRSATPVASARVGTPAAGVPAAPALTARPAGATPRASATVTPLSSVRQPSVGTPAAGTPAAGTPSAGVPSSGTPSAGRRPINPFLKADPAERARRLARALVSDLVAYQPKKREEGLRDGTLRQLFREEIKKSYEEYVEQVGRDVAEQSPHFQDALNDILAGGRRLF